MYKPPPGGAPAAMGGNGAPAGDGNGDGNGHDPFGARPDLPRPPGDGGSGDDPW
jgi:hypothetical protein